MTTPTFTLVDDANGKFIIDGNLLKVAAALDFEANPSLNITIGVSGVTPAAPNRSFTISVMDVEEPTINLSGMTIAENAVSGIAVGMLSVVNVTGTPVFSLVDSAGGKFVIAGNTLTGWGPFDYEIASSHNVTVAVSGVAPAAPNRTFNIAVVDVPKGIILSSNTIAEDAVNGANIGELSVWEGTGTYVFTIIDDPDGLFTIDGDNLDKPGMLDRETKDSHQITIQADNGVDTPITQTFTIYVTNVEDVDDPVAVTFTPVDNSSFVDPTTSLSVLFNVAVRLNTGNIYLKKTSDNSIVETWNVATEEGSTAGRVETIDQLLVMHPTEGLAPEDEELYVVWDEGVVTNLEDDPVAALSSTTAWSFTLGAFALDTLTPGVAYGFRKLVAAYAGDCVRIRASGDNAEDDFGFVDDEVDVAGIAAFVTTHGGSPFIVTWYDQSANAVHVTQATAANQPAFIASGINSLPTARFDGTNDGLASSNVLGTTILNVDEATIMGIAKQDGTQAQNAMFGWYPSMFDNASLQFTTDNILYWDFGDGSGTGSRVNVAQPAGWDDNPHVIECYRTVADNQAIIVDGSTLAASSRNGPVNPVSSGPVCVGAFGGLFFKGDISEFFILKTDIGITNRDTARVNMATRYGIDV